MVQPSCKISEWGRTGRGEYTSHVNACVTKLSMLDDAVFVFMSGSRSARGCSNAPVVRVLVCV